MGTESSKLMSAHVQRMLNDRDYSKVDLELLSRDKDATMADCHSREYHAAVSMLFRSMDDDSNGYIDGSEIPNLIKSLQKVYKKHTGKTMKSNFVTSIIRSNDANRDSKIDYKEFSGIMDDIFVEIRREKETCTK
uniref:EF-hand domain-containing protein n=1 Tax=Vannella robusta TaxID=1487602 RepID=A0A7S4MCK6_9EUKA|mmetsp:Transcript_18160/g.23000  ORF Transcript_18160/g.23000 Transcript_18160/m.23000 type:complete len:135 (+) Transcript_18160:14-418(+)